MFESKNRTRRSDNIKAIYFYLAQKEMIDLDKKK